MVYKTTNTSNQKQYIGVHGFYKLNDGYIGSGHVLKEAIAKYGKSNFLREVLFIYDTEQEAYEKEKELVDLSVVLNSNFYNVVGGGKAPGMISEESRKKISDRNKGTRKKSARTIEVKAINLVTGEELIFPSILECSQSLGISYSAVLKVCKRRYGSSKVYNWTFETSKFGKTLIAVTNNYPGISKNSNKFLVKVGEKYLGYADSLEEAVLLQSDYIKSVVPKNKKQELTFKKYKLAHDQFINKSCEALQKDN